MRTIDANTLPVVVRISFSAFCCTMLTGCGAEPTQDGISVVKFSPVEAQSALKTMRGSGWLVHPIGDAVGPLHLDYYALTVSEMPRQQEIGTNRMSPEQLFEWFKAFLLDKNRASESRISFEALDPEVKLNRVGAVVLMRMSPFSFVNASTRSGSSELEWIKSKGALLDATRKAWVDRNQDRGYFVVSAVTNREFWLSAIRTGEGSFGPLANPVAGNRLVGILPEDSTWVLYTRGAYRANIALPGKGLLDGTEPDDMLLDYGNALMDVAWRDLFEEFRAEITRQGAVVTSSKYEHLTTDWEPRIGTKPDSSKLQQWR